MLRNKLQF